MPLTFAIFLYVIVAVVVLRIEARLLPTTEGVAVVDWITERVYLPLLRYGAVLVFLLAGYPHIFGIDDAPPVQELFTAGSGRLDLLINIGLALSLALPLIPVANQVPGIVLTAQAVLTACVLVSWLAPHLGVNEPRYFMGWPIIAAVFALNVLAWLMGRALLAVFDEARQSRGRLLLMDGLRLLAELPAVLIYTFALGRQL